jgi:hypothetical protein
LAERWKGETLEEATAVWRRLFRDYRQSGVVDAHNRQAPQSEFVSLASSPLVSGKCGAAKSDEEKGAEPGAPL